jgi:hypothetical protein
VENADPEDLLLTEISQAAGTVAGLRALIGDLDPDDVVAGTARPFYDVYGEAQAQLMKYAELGVRLGLEQRRTALAEALSGLVFGLIRNVLAAASLTQDQPPRRWLHSSPHSPSCGLNSTPRKDDLMKFDDEMMRASLTPRSARWRQTSRWRQSWSARARRCRRPAGSHQAGPRHRCRHHDRRRPGRPGARGSRCRRRLAHVMTLQVPPSAVA